MLLRSLVDIPEPLLYAPVAAELREFLVRYPDLPESGVITILLGRHYFRNEAHRPAILIEQKVLALYKDPALLAKAQYQIGDIYATALKDFNKAVEAYQTVTEKYPDTPEVSSAYVRIAKILDENLNQSALAVEKLEEIVKLYPKTEAAHDAYLETARIQKAKLNAANKAVAALEALADMFPGDRAVSALKQAAEISDGLKDYASEARIYEKLAESTPQDKFAPEALWEAADVYEKKLLDPSAAKKAMEKLVSAHPSSKLFKKAQKRLQAMNK
jgi:tetratricopeptide (TPR) repeat protein